MATIETTGSLTTTLGGWLRHLRSELREEQRRRRVYADTRSQLAMLSDRDLLDIGISRLEIADIARDAAYRTR
jgi:uncharacterized protein YjiS (DUF1127 family)